MAREHVHCYQPTAYLTLTLPAHDGTHEAYREWLCVTCAQRRYFTMALRHTVTGVSPSMLDETSLDEKAHKRPQSIVNMKTMKNKMQWVI